MNRFIVSALALGAAALSSACASTNAARDPHPDHRLAHMLKAESKAAHSDSPCLELWEDRDKTADCERVVNELERLYAEFPRHQRVLFVNAFMQYQYGRPEQAQFLLDELLSTPGSHPEAAILRAQLALREGSSTRARKLLQTQLRLRPDHSGLHETMSSALYLSGRYDEASHHLELARVLGAPAARIRYHEGLLLEAQGQVQSACNAYAAAYQSSDRNSQPLHRLIGLSRNSHCANTLTALR
ncbi:MAG: tetratricopeptide repeat protein [Oceanococcaceae bacterium]